MNKKYFGGYPKIKSQLELDKVKEEHRAFLAKLEDWSVRAERKSRCAHKGAIMHVEIPFQFWEELMEICGWENQDSPQEMGWVDSQGKP